MFDIAKKILRTKAKKIKRYPCKSNRASGLGYYVPALGGCLRRGVYERTRWQEKELHDPEVQLIFDEGNNQERVVLNDMIEAGFDPIEQQTMYEWPEKNITGHIDCKLVDPETGQAVPVEIKSMNPNIWTQMKTFNDLKKKPWTRVYLAQITIYMLMQNIDRAVFVLKNKSTGQIKEIDIGLDYDLGEACIKTAERINDHVNAGTLPDQIDDREVCARCPYKLICLPEIEWGEPLKLRDDPIFETRIDKYLDLKQQSDECKKLYETIRNEAKAEAGESGELNIVIGKYRLTGKLSASKSFILKIDKI